MGIEHEVESCLGVLDAKTNLHWVSIQVTDLEISFFCLRVVIDVKFYGCPIEALYQNFDHDYLAVVFVLRRAECVELLLLALLKQVNFSVKRFYWFLGNLSRPLTCFLLVRSNLDATGQTIVYCDDRKKHQISRSIQLSLLSLNACAVTLTVEGSQVNTGTLIQL